MRQYLVLFIQVLMVLSLFIIGIMIFGFAFSVANICQGKARPIDIAMIWIYASAFVTLFVPLLLGINPFDGSGPIDVRPYIP